MERANSPVSELLGRPARLLAPAASAVSAPSGEQEYSAFAQGRISRHAQRSIVFRRADGSAQAFAYSFYYGAESSDPDTGFTLDFMQHKVKVQGRRLEPLFRLICEHRVAEVREADRQTSFDSAQDSPIVERVDITAAHARPKSPT